MEDVIHSRHSENQDLHPKVTHTYSSAILKLQQNFLSQGLQASWIYNIGKKYKLFWIKNTYGFQILILTSSEK